MKNALFAISVIFAATLVAPAQAQQRSAEYAAVQARLQQGWNSWDTSTVTGQVLLPDGLEIRLGVQRATTLNSDAFLSTALIGRQGADDERVFPGPHAYDGSYSTLRLDWRGVSLQVETAHDGDDLVMLVTPLARPASQPAIAVFSAGLLWNRPGTVSREPDRIVANLPGKTVGIYAAGSVGDDPHVPVQGPYFAVRLDGPAGVATGKARSIAEIRAVIDRARSAFLARTEALGSAGSAHGAIETVLSWDTIYDPEKGRVVTPVSRIWNGNWGGYVLFDWDTFFAASMASLDNRDLAYANAEEILNEMTPSGMVPNYGRARGWKSSDRSEPPIGAITIWSLYARHHDRWLLSDAYDRLKAWNAWWPEHRGQGDYLVWGSDPTLAPVNPDDGSVGTLQGAKYESGLDNSPMYDGAAYDPATHTMQLADVGLISLYIADCDAMARIAAELGLTKDARIFQARAARYRRGLDTLWDARTGIYRNRDLRSGALSPRLSPTNLYPLLAGIPAARADAMIGNHLLNPTEFWGERVLPSITRDDPAFADQDYWRGRIWGPMNYLVWLGLGHAGTPSARQAQAELGKRSLDLFLGEWQAKGHVHENYSATGPDSDTVSNSDRFYHWGALLGLMGPGVQ